MWGKNEKITFHFFRFCFHEEMHQQVVTKRLCNVLHGRETWRTGQIPSRHLHAHRPWTQTKALRRYVCLPDGGCRCASFFFFLFFFSRWDTLLVALDMEEIVQRYFYFGVRRSQSRFSLRHDPDRRGCCTHANAARFPRLTASFIVVTSRVSAHISLRRLPWKLGASIWTIPGCLKPQSARELKLWNGVIRLKRQKIHKDEKIYIYIFTVGVQLFLSSWWRQRKLLDYTWRTYIRDIYYRGKNVLGRKEKKKSF